MKKEIYLTTRLNEIKKQKLNFFASFKIFFKLYFKNINIFKFSLFLKPSFSISLFVLFFVSISTYSYGSNSITNSSYLYKIKNGIENIVLITKKTELEKIEYYSFLVDRRISEIDYLDKNNFKNSKNDFSLIKTAYADDQINFSSSIANTLKDINDLNIKIDNEYSKIKEDDIKLKAEKIILNKENKEKLIIEKIKAKKDLLNSRKDIKENTLKEIDVIINKIEENKLIRIEKIEKIKENRAKNLELLNKEKELRQRIKNEDKTSKEELKMLKQENKDTIKENILENKNMIKDLRGDVKLEIKENIEKRKELKNILEEKRNNR